MITLEQSTRPQRIDYVTVVLLLCIFFSLGIIVLEAYQYQINPDAVAYISIAQKYVRGDFVHAINGYWSPLFSWVLIPLIALGVPPLLAAKISGLFVGFFILIIVWHFSFRFLISPSVRLLILSLLPFITLYFISSVVSPDLLLTLLLLSYFFVLWDPKYSQQAWKGALCGFLGALAYLTKAYALPFFAVHFCVFHLLHFRQRPETKRRLLCNFLLGMLVFGILSGAWMVILGNKYGYFTTGTVGKHNFFSLGPAYNGFEKVIFDLNVPPNDTAININEDPSAVALSPWHPFLSFSHFFHFLRIVFANLRELFMALALFSAFVPFVLIGELAGLFPYFGRFRISQIEKDTMWTILIYPAGYLLTIIEFRYLWPLGILLLLLSASFLSRLLERFMRFLSLRLRIFVVVVFVFSWVFFPLAYLWKNRDADRDILFLAQEIKDYGVDGNMASNFHWYQMLYLGYYLELRYLGQVPSGISWTKLSEVLQKYRIDYYFHWDQDSAPAQFGGYEKMMEHGIRNLVIYRRTR